MPSERREKGTQAPPRSRMPAPPRRRGRGGVGLAEGVRCGGRVASVVPTGRGHWSADVVCWVPAALRLMPSETRERDAGAAAVADPAPPRTRGRGGVGLAEGARCGGRVASVVDRGRWHRSADVVRGSRSAPRRCRGSPPPRRLAIARNLSLTAALKKNCCKTRAHFKSWLVRRGRVCCAILHPHHRACSAQQCSQPCASQRGAAPCLPLQKRLAQPARALAFFALRCTLRPRARRRHGQKEARHEQAVPGLR